ncbi:MAG: endolytic transglycosylase MltG, partial [Solirubrobacterales bacterium]|nr:endolytic transglycosylase MltG [Solirubrobacterales bacterium]
HVDHPEPGEAPWEAPPVAEEPAPVEPPAPAEEPTYAPAPVAEEPTYVAPPPPPEEPTYAPPPVADEPVYAEPPAAPAEEPAPAAPSWLDEPAPAPAYAEASAEQPQTEEHGAVATSAERPVQLRRAPSPSVADLPKVAGPKPARPRGVPRGRRGLRRVVPLLLLLLLAAVAVFAYKLFQPFAGEGSGQVRVVIPSGSTASDIATILEEQDVIDSAFFFNIRTRLSGKREDLKAGTHTLRRDMSYGAAIDALTENPAAPKVVKVTLPEGPSIHEAAPLVRQSGLKGSYIAAAERAPRSAGIRTISVPKGTRTLEGFLFPASYELRRGSTAEDLVAQQLAAFKRNFDEVDLRAARRANLSAYDVLIIASMIEREAQVAKERRLVAAVIYNRLKQGIPLGIDATIRYRLNNWSRPLRVSELNIDSEYNTRKRQGLPPTPIGSPGLASLKAAANPANVGYLYYVVKPCGGGTHSFSSTDAEFQKDVAAYNRKRDALGGKDPSDC